MSRVAGTEGISVVVCLDEVDRATVSRMISALVDGLHRLDGAANEHRAALPLVTVDLSAVCFIDASGVQALLDADRVARRHGSALQVHGAVRSVRRVFDAAGVAGYLLAAAGSDAA